MSDQATTPQQDTPAPAEQPQQPAQAPAVQPTTAVAAPALLNDIIADAGKGHTDNADDFAIPYLSVIQSNSPQINKQKAEYIKDAEVGMIFNTVNNKLYDGEEGVEVIPVAFKKSYIEWKPRDLGGNFVASYDRLEGQSKELTCTQNDEGQSVLPNGNILKASNQHFVVVVDKDGHYPAILSFMSTQIKKSAQWNSMMREQTVEKDGAKIVAPTYAYRYKLTTIGESNNKGDWMGIKITPVSWVQDSNLFQFAKKFHEQASAGAVKTAEPAQDSSSFTKEKAAQHM